MSLYDSEKYMKDVAEAAERIKDYSKLSCKRIAISGGTGMIGSFLTDMLFYRNEVHSDGIHIYILGRNEIKAEERFAKYVDSEYFHFIQCDINDEISLDKVLPEKMDYIIHAASNTHPRAYSSDPIGTITANVIGANNLLRWASNSGCERFLYLSSVEIYGENKGDIDKFDETYLGYIDSNTMRAGYPESKRVGEALCQAYIADKGLDIVIPRLSRVYGPTMLMSDSKALSQFILKGVHGEDIVLKSAGTQEYSYAYVADAAYGILFLLLNGECGVAYNVASRDSDITLKELAETIAEFAGRKVVFELPDDKEKAGYSKATKATLDISRLDRIGYESAYDIKKGIEHTLTILREI